MGQLGSNRRLGSVSERAALLYLVALPYGDREGRLPGNPAELLDEVCPVLARRWNWDEAVVAGATSELVSCGLWTTWEANGQRVIGIEKWTDHQHPSKLAEERPSAFPPPDPLPSPIQSNPIQSKACSGDFTGEPARTVLPVHRAPPGVKSVRSEFEIDVEEQRIRACWIEGRPESWKANARGLSMKEKREIKNAAEENLCAEWPEEQDLTSRIRGKVVEFEAGKYTIGPDAIIRNLKRTAAPQQPMMLGPIGLIHGGKLREEMVAIAAEETPEGRSSARAALDDLRAKIGSRKRAGRGDAFGTPRPDGQAGPLARIVAGVVERAEVLR